MISIDSYEVIRADNGQEVLLSMNSDPHLGHHDGETLTARFCGLDLQVHAATDFFLSDLPESATEYLCERGEIRLAEFGPVTIDRLVTLVLIE